MCSFYCLEIKATTRLKEFAFWLVNNNSLYIERKDLFSLFFYGIYLLGSLDRYKTWEIMQVQGKKKEENQDTLSSTRGGDNKCMWI